jgi:hypothetical protein
MYAKKTSKKKLATELPSIPKDLLDRIVGGPMESKINHNSLAHDPGVFCHLYW